MPNPPGQPTFEDFLLGLLHGGNVVLSIARAVDTLNRAVENDEDPLVVGLEILQQVSEAADRARGIEGLRFPPAVYGFAPPPAILPRFGMGPPPPPFGFGLAVPPPPWVAPTENQVRWE